MPYPSNSPAVEQETETIIRPQEPKKYKVILHNDNTTSFDFVIHVLMTIFHKTQEQAISLTEIVHMQGAGIAGVYTQEVAEMKTTETIELAQRHGYPLKVTYEEF